VNFLVDAQLPRRLALRLRDAQHDVLHTLDLPNGNRTTDAEINGCPSATAGW
jgi:predicted nuclease of predicted toxin-antitoxin system